VRIDPEIAEPATTSRPPFSAETLPASKRQATRGTTPFEKSRAVLQKLFSAIMPSESLARSSAWLGAQRILIFFVVFSVVLVAVDQAIKMGMRRIKTSAFGASNRAMAGQVNADIVISGSSRALTHYQSKIIEDITGRRTFNIGRNGSQTDMQLAFLKAYLKNNRKPELVIHNLDLFSFQTSKEIYDPAQYMPFLDQAPIYDAILQVYPDVWKWKYLPLYGYIAEDMRFSWLLGVKALFGIQPREDHIQGFLPRHTRWTGDFEKYRDDNPDGVHTEIEIQGVRDVEELVALCKEAGVPLLLVYSPEYHEMQTLERNRDEVFNKIHEICHRFDVPLWDYSGSPISQDRAYFYNSQHLNAVGARVFSSELAHRLIDTAELPVSDKGSSTVRR
jgi:hypothetical protein